MAKICRNHRRRDCSTCHQYRHNPIYWITDSDPGSSSYGSDSSSSSGSSYDGGSSSSDGGGSSCGGGE